MNIGRKIYFDKSTGNVLVDTGERSGNVVETTQEQDFASYLALAERVPSTVGVITLPYGQDLDKFGSYAYRVDAAAETIVWDLTPIQQEEVQAQVAIEQRISDIETVILQMQGVI
jgi:hypothetical protein